MIPSTIPATSTHCPAVIFRYFTNAFTSTVNPIKPKITDGIPATRSIKARQTDASFFGMKKVRKQAHATPNIIANSTASPDTYKVPVTAGRRPYCGAALTGRHSDDGRNILIPTSFNAGILSFKICISIIPISAATTKAIIYIKTLQNVFAIFLYITKSFLAYFGKKKDVSIRHTLFHIFLFHWNESHIFYSLLSCLSKDNIQECLLNICRIP